MAAHHSNCFCNLFENPDALQKLAELNPHCMPSGEDAGGGGGTSRASGKRTSAGTGKSISGAELLGGEWKMAPNPAWIAKRLEQLEKIKARNSAMMTGVDKPAITVTLPDGKQMPGVAWETTPLAIAGALSKGLQQAVVTSSVRYKTRLKGMIDVVEMATNPDEDDAPKEEASKEAQWETWDASRPLEGDCELQLLKFDDPRGKEVCCHCTHTCTHAHMHRRSTARTHTRARTRAHTHPP